MSDVPGDPPSGVAATLARIREDYVRGLSARIEAIRQDWAGARAGSAGAVEDARRAAHGIAGAAGTLGLREVSALARSLEDALDAWEAAPGCGDRVDARLADLEHAAGNASRGARSGSS